MGESGDEAVCLGVFLRKGKEVLFGEYFCQTDEKGRVRIPAKLKPSLSDNVTVTKGTNGCLFLFASNEWHEKLALKLGTVPMSDLTIQRSIRTFFGGASTLEEDNQGRSLLPKNLREYAEIKKDIVIIGVGNRAEIWARENYEKYMRGESVDKLTDFDKLFTELQKYGV